MSPTVSFARALVASSIAAVGGWCALAGCQQSAPTTAYTPITGIAIPSAELVVGHGCGTRGQEQVYKYAAIVTYYDAGPNQESGAAADDSGVDQDAAAASEDAGDNQDSALMMPSAVTSGIFDCFADGVFSNLPQSDAGNLSFTIQIYAYNACSFPSGLACPQNTATHCPAEDPNSVASQPSNWTATCMATQVTGVTAIADCSPLEPGDAASPCADASTE